MILPAKKGTRRMTSQELMQHGWYETPEATWRHPDMGEDRFTLACASDLMNNIIRLGYGTVKGAQEE